MSHQTRDIYAFNLLRSSKVELSNDKSYLVSRLVDIDSQQSTGQTSILDFAQQVVETYNVLDAGFEVERVCLSFCSPFSRKLTIVSSHNTDDSGVEDLVPGYHCYVSPLSSLFAVPFGDAQSGRIRVYSDIEKVIRSFRSRNMPVQRTIGKLAAAGYRSGISLSLAMGAWGSGLLFLNSKSVGAFDSFEDSDYLSTCILRMVASAAILRSKHNPKTIDRQLAAAISSLNPVSNVCSASQFVEHLTKAVLIRFGTKLKFQVQSSVKHPFFYPSQTAILLILKAMEYLRFDDLAPVEICFSALEPDLMRVHIDFGSRQSAQFGQGQPAISSLAESSGFDLSIDDAGLVITTQYQSLNSAELECGYSTYS